MVECCWCKFFSYLEFFSVVQKFDFMHGGQVSVKKLLSSASRVQVRRKRKLNKNHFLADPEFFGGNGKTKSDRKRADFQPHPVKITKMLRRA